MKYDIAFHVKILRSSPSWPSHLRGACGRGAWAAGAMEGIGTAKLDTEGAGMAEGWVRSGMVWGGGVKLDNFWNKKKQSQISSLTTHEGYNKTNKAQASRFCSTISWNSWTELAGSFTISSGIYESNEPQKTPKRFRWRPARDVMREGECWRPYRGSWPDLMIRRRGRGLRGPGGGVVVIYISLRS